MRLIRSTISNANRFRAVEILTESLATSLRCGLCLLDLTRVKSGRACLPRQARQPRQPDRRAPIYEPSGVRRFPCLPPCGVKQSGRAFPHWGTACPTLEPLSPGKCRPDAAVKPGNTQKRIQILPESLATSLRCGWCLPDLTRVKSGRACHQPRHGCCVLR